MGEVLGKLAGGNVSYPFLNHVRELMLEQAVRDGIGDP
jgi:hypothetical protein